MLKNDHTSSLRLSLSPRGFTVHKRTLPIERPPLVGEVSANFCVVSAETPHGRNFGFLDRSRYYFFQVATQLSSRG
jgi:hypothetical protein